MITKNESFVVNKVYDILKNIFLLYHHLFETQNENFDLMSSLEQSFKEIEFDLLKDNDEDLFFSKTFISHPDFLVKYLKLTHNK